MKSRYFAIVTYLEPEQFIEIITKHSSSIRSYCFIQHYKEKTDNHYHIAIRTYSVWELKQVQNWFTEKEYLDTNGNKVNSFAEYVKDRNGLRDYLTHKNETDPYKFTYEEEEIQGNVEDVLPKDKDTNNAFDIISDIANGKKINEIVKSYGTEFIHYYKNYIEIARLMKEENENENC